MEENFPASAENSCTGGALLVNSVTSSHLVDCLRSLKHPEESIQSMLKCGKATGFEVLSHCKSCSNLKFIPLKHHCSQRTCQECSKIRRRRIYKDYYPILKDYSLNPRTREFLYFLSISPKNYKSYKEGLKESRKSFSKFIRNKYLKERIIGGLYVIETKNTGKDWHVHLHCIIYGRWIDNKVRLEGKNSKIVSIWNKCSNRDVHMNIKRLSSTQHTLNYMLKYISISKEDFQTEEQLAEYIVGSRNQKLIVKFGSFFRAKFPRVFPVCCKCGGDIEFIIDQEVIRIIREARSNPPPKDLEFYGFSENKKAT